VCHACAQCHTCTDTSTWCFKLSILLHHYANNAQHRKVAKHAIQPRGIRLLRDTIHALYYEAINFRVAYGLLMIIYGSTVYPLRPLRCRSRYNCYSLTTHGLNLSARDPTKFDVGLSTKETRYLEPPKLLPEDIQEYNGIGLPQLLSYEVAPPTTTILLRAADWDYTPNESSSDCTAPEFFPSLPDLLDGLINSHLDSNSDILRGYLAVLIGYSYLYISRVNHRALAS
jgi:hypothetical protein